MLLTNASIIFFAIWSRHCVYENYINLRFTLTNNLFCIFQYKFVTFTVHKNGNDYLTTSDKSYHDDSAHNIIK